MLAYLEAALDDCDPGVHVRAAVAYHSISCVHSAGVHVWKEAPMENAMDDADWEIRRAGRAWTLEEFDQRADLRPEKLEIWEGRLLWSDEERVLLLGLLLENVGADRAVRLGNPQVWRDAIAVL